MGVSGPQGLILLISPVNRCSLCRFKVFGESEDFKPKQCRRTFDVISSESLEEFQCSLAALETGQSPDRDEGSHTTQQTSKPDCSLKNISEVLKQALADFQWEDVDLENGSLVAPSPFRFTRSTSKSMSTKPVRILNYVILLSSSTTLTCQANGSLRSSWLSSLPPSCKASCQSVVSIALHLASKSIGLLVVDISTTTRFGSKPGVGCVLQAIEEMGGAVVPLEVILYADRLIPSQSVLESYLPRELLIRSNGSAQSVEPRFRDERAACVNRIQLLLKKSDKVLFSLGRLLLRILCTEEEQADIAKDALSNTAKLILHRWLEVASLATLSSQDNVLICMPDPDDDCLDRKCAFQSLMVHMAAREEVGVLQLFRPDTASTWAVIAPLTLDCATIRLLNELPPKVKPLKALPPVLEFTFDFDIAGQSSSAEPLTWQQRSVRLCNGEVALASLGLSEKHRTELGALNTEELTRARSWNRYAATPER